METSEREIRVLGVAGSLRRGSYNKALLRAAQELAPAAGMRIEPYDIADIPLYNDDVFQAGAPEPVRRLKDAIRAAEGVIFATPEYNYGIPGVLKNAIDWASRPPEETPFKDKPIGIMGASPGGFGTVRAQMALRPVMNYNAALTMPQPELLVSRAKEKFDAELRLMHEDTRKALARWLAAFSDWVVRHRA